MFGLWVAHPVANINKVNDLALILLISVFSLMKSVKNVSFCCTFYNHLMRCSFSVVNPIVVMALLLFTLLLAKNI